MRVVCVSVCLCENRISLCVNQDLAVGGDWPGPLV